LVEIRKPIPFLEAVELIMNHVQALGTESVPLLESYGRILAEAIVAQHDVPPFQRALYDGFAIRSIDSAGANEQNKVSFRVIEHIGAGSVISKSLKKGEAVRIMTGASMPLQTDAVVMLEQAEICASGDCFTIQKPFAPMEHVTLQGEDAKSGEELIEQGNYIHPGMTALLATFGYANVQVAKKPVVGIIATGSELLEVHEPLIPGKIRNSNGPMIAAQLARMGLPVRSYGMMKDNIESGLSLMQKAIAEVDCVITTGGVSVGDFDYLPVIYERIGAKVLFNKAAMRPGSVTTVAVLNGTLLFGLSGNPSSCYIGFELFARPALLKMMGSCKPYLPHTKAVLLEDFTKSDPFTRFVRSIYRFDGNQATIIPAGFDRSNSVSSIALGNAFMVLPIGIRNYQAGDSVDVLLLGVEEGESQLQI